MKQKTLIMLTCILFAALSVSIIGQNSEPQNQEAIKLFNEGNSLLNAGNYNGAIENYQKALNIEKHYKIYYQIGLAYKKAGKLEDSKNSFTECLKLKSDFVNAYNGLGGTFFSIGDYSNAVSNFEKGLSLTKDASTQKKFKKNISLAYGKLGEKEISNANPTKAIEYLTKAIENDNSDAAYLKLAQLYAELGEWDKSISASESAIKFKSKITSGGPYFYMGLSYKGKGDTSKAKEMFEKAKSDATYKKNAEYELSLLN